MHRHRSLSRQKPSIQRLFDRILPKKSSKSNNLAHELAEEEEEDTQNHPSSDVTCSSSSIVNKYRKVKKDQGTSTDRTSKNVQSEQVRKFLIYYRLDSIV